MRPFWKWTIGGLAAIVVLNAIFGDDNKNKVATKTVTVTHRVAPSIETETTAGAPTNTITDARDAVDSDDYAKAVTIARVLGTHQEGAIRHRIANRIARNASAALSDGDRGQAKALLIRAERFPTTTLTRNARASYRVAKARAADRAQARRVAAEQRAAQKKAAEQAKPDAAANCDPNYTGACLNPNSADYDCAGGSGDGPDYTGPVQSVGSDPFDLDRDGDGFACE